MSAIAAAPSPAPLQPERAIVLSVPSTSFLVCSADMKFHECDQCKELFPTPALLQVHIKCQHSGERPSKMLPCHTAPGSSSPPFAAVRSRTLNPPPCLSFLICTKGTIVVPLSSQCNCKPNLLVPRKYVRRGTSEHPSSATAIITVTAVSHQI